MAGLRFQFFGPPCFERNGVPIKVGRRKAVALAVYLVVTGKPHSRDHLADLFWQESDRDKARASLRRTLSVMTKALGRFWLSIDRDTIGFAPHEDLWVDVVRFQELTAHRSSDSEQALQEAASVYENGFLNGFSLGDAPDFDDWQFEQAEAFGRSAARVLKHLAELCMHRMDLASAIAHARRRLAFDPFDETAHRQLIRLYHKDGQPRAALRQYEKCRDLLQKELNIEPEDKTIALVEVVRATASDQVNPISLPLKNLPVQSSTFVGRKNECRTLTGMVQDPKIKLITLTGPGGIGKTRLALEVAAGLEDRFPHGVFFISLAELATLEATDLIRSFGLSFDEQSDPLKQLLAFLGHGERLLVLDNFEHLAEGGMLVSKIMDRAAGLKVLVTSRTRLMLKGEHLFPLSGLDSPLVKTESDGIQTAEQMYDAVALFLSSARMVRPDFKLTALNFHGVTRICNLTGGMPLALILAAGMVELYSPEEIAKGIQMRLGFLKTEIRDIPSCHKSMRAVFEASFSRLPENEKKNFLKLTVFSNGFSLNSLTAVAGDGEDSTTSTTLALVRQSMLNTDSGTGRFHIHPLLRQYGREGLVHMGLYEGIMDAHKTHYLDLVNKNGSSLIGDGMLACRRDMDADFANIRQAWCRAVDQGDFAALALAAQGLYVYFDMHTRYHEGEALFQPAKELVMTSYKTLTDPNHGILLLCWFDMQTQGADSPEAFWELKRAGEFCLRKAIKRKNNQAKACAFLLMGAVAQKQMLYQRAIRFYRLSLKTDPVIEHSFWVTIRIGLCWRTLGDMDQAIKRFRQSRAIGLRLGDAVKQAWSLGNIGSAELCKGNLAEAESCLASADRAFLRLNAPVGTVMTLEELALISFLKGELSLAVSQADQALKISKDAGLAQSRYQRAHALKGLALIATNDLDQGHICLKEVLNTETSSFTALLGMSLWACVKGNDSLAGEYLKSAGKSMGSVHKPQLKALFLLAGAAVAVQEGKDGTACELLSTLFHHPDCPNELFRIWKFPEILLSMIKSRMLPETFKKIWEQE